MNNETNETNETNEKILQLQAEREADRILHQLRMRKLHEPQSRDDQAQKESRGREVFSVVCRKNNLSGCEANFRVLFDADLLDSEYAATQAITSGAVQLAEASPQEA